LINKNFVSESLNVIYFSLKQGDKGDIGETGLPGIPGQKGIMGDQGFPAPAGGTPGYTGIYYLNLLSYSYTESYI